jgi:hypothetical protein
MSTFGPLDFDEIEVGADTENQELVTSWVLLAVRTDQELCLHRDLAERDSDGPTIVADERVWSVSLCELDAHRVRRRPL